MKTIVPSCLLMWISVSFALTPTLHAQAVSIATVTGRVTDDQGAVLPGAQIKITNVCCASPVKQGKNWRAFFCTQWLTSRFLRNNREETGAGDFLSACRRPFVFCAGVGVSRFVPDDSSNEAAANLVKRML